MSAQRPPWWMYVITASYLAVFALIYYLVIWGPSDIEGLQPAFGQDGMRIQAVTPESTLATAGLRAGDIVRTVDGLPIRTARDWNAVQFNLEVGKPEDWQILRGDERIELHFTPKRATWGNRLAHGYVLYVSLSLSCFLLGLFIGFRRPGDPSARIGSWFITTASIAFGLPNGWAAMWRQMPLLVQALLWIPQVSRFLIEGIFVSLFALFPRRLFRARWLWFVVWIPVVSTLPWRVSEIYSIVYHPGHAPSVPQWLLPATNLRIILYLITGVVLLAVSYCRLANLNERRRVRVMVLGTAISLLAAIPVIWAFTWGEMYSPAYLSLAFPVFLLTLACPLAFAYAILRYRVFDIQVIVRQGLQYALARGAVLGVVPVLAAILLLDLVINRRQPLGDILEARGWIYAGLGGLALLAYWQRKPWLETLDRRFFRERYDAQRILREVVGEIREARGFERVAPRVVSRIESAIHPEFVSVMVCEAGQHEYRPLASAPSDRIVPPLAADSKLVALARVLGKPLEVLLADSAWLSQRLPREEVEFAREARIDLLAPIAGSAGQKEAVLALGIKRSEEPYTREDQELLEAIADSLALLLEQPAAAERPSGVFEECPECGGCYDSGLGRCGVEGAGLVSMGMPRTLAGRYRLERRLGRGGMGTVYEATDRSLERRVAVKLIREDWVGSDEAAQRFQREARTSAGFAHPNVVTVHDYGVEAGRRAFLVMELLKGGTLRDELKRRTRLEASRTIGILRGVCAAVEAAHRRQLIHRDLKPENIFLARLEGADKAGETVKVLDFGIAKFLSSSDDAAVTRTDFDTGAGILVGTFAYMSPEQLMGESPAVSWDLWALGVVVYETLTGSLPFKPVPVEDWKSAVLSGRFTALTEYIKEPPSQWQNFFVSCFASNRADRPRSAEEFLHNLEVATGHSSSRFVSSGLDTTETRD